MLGDREPFFTFQDIVLEAEGNYTKRRRNFFILGAPLNNEEEVLIETLSGDILNERISRVKASGDCVTEVQLDRYLSTSAINFLPSLSGESALTFYLRDSSVFARGDSRQGKMLLESIYKQNGEIDHIKILQLPRVSYQRMAVQMGLEKIETRELIEQGVMKLDKDPVVQDVAEVLAELEMALGALEAASYSESARTRRALILGGFNSDTDYYVNLDGQRQIPYGQSTRFNDRTTTISRDKDQLSVRQTSLAPGYYQSFVFELPTVMSESAVGKLFVLPDQSWRNFFDGMHINGSVVETQSS